MKTPLLLFVVCFTTALGPLSAAVVYDNGAPDQRSGFEMTHWIEADQFTLTSSTILQGVTFWEAEAGADFRGVVVWEIFDDANNAPGNLLASGTSANLTHSSTGRVVLSAYPEYIDNFTIGSVSLAPGKYWLGLHNGQLSDNVSRNTFWETASNSSTVPSQAQVAPFDGPFFGNGTNTKLAFQLSGLIAPPPKITSIQYNNGTPTFVFTSASGLTYRAQYKNDLSDPTWNTVAGAATIYGFKGSIQVTDSDPAVRNFPHRYYRVILL